MVATGRTAFVVGNAATAVATLAADPVPVWRLFRALVIGGAIACKACGSRRSIRQVCPVHSVGFGVGVARSLVGIGPIGVVTNVDGLVAVVLGVETVWAGRTVGCVVRSISAFGTVVVIGHVCLWELWMRKE